MNQRGNALVWVILAVLVVAGLVYWGTQKPAENNGVVENETETETERVEIPEGDLKIGVVLPLSGDAAVYGQDFLPGIELAVEEINAAGGVDGHQIKLVVEDGKCNPEGGAAAGTKLINVDQVNFIVGGACSGETLGFAPLANEAKVVSISPSATSPDITTAGDYTFRTAPSDALAGSIAADYAYNDLKAASAAIIYETTDYGQGLEKAFAARFAELGGEVVVDEGFATGDVDFTAQALKVKNKNPEVIYVVPNTPTAGIQVIKQLRANGVLAQVLTAEVLASDDILKDNPVDLQGVVAIEPYYNQESAKAAAFLAAYTAKQGNGPTFPFFAAGGYSDVYLLAEAITAVGYDSTAVARYLTGLKNWEGALGTISFNEMGDVVTQYAIKKAVDSRYEQVKVTP